MANRVRVQNLYFQAKIDAFETCEHAPKQLFVRVRKMQKGKVMNLAECFPAVWQQTLHQSWSTAYDLAAREAGRKEMIQVMKMTSTLVSTKSVHFISTG